MTRPIMGSPLLLGLNDAPSFGQNRSPVSYSAPHCGQTLATVRCSSASGVGCRARSPDPMLVCRLDPSGGDLRPVSAESALPPAIRDCGFGWSLLGMAQGDVSPAACPLGRSLMARTHTPKVLGTMNPIAGEVIRPLPRPSP